MFSVFQQDPPVEAFFRAFSARHTTAETFSAFFSARQRDLSECPPLFSKTHLSKPFSAPFQQDTQPPKLFPLFFSKTLVGMLSVFQQDTPVEAFFRAFSARHTTAETFSAVFQQDTCRNAFCFSARHTCRSLFRAFSARHATAVTFSVAFQQDTETCRNVFRFSARPTCRSLSPRFFSKTHNRRNFFRLFFSKTQRLVGMLSVLQQDTPVEAFSTPFQLCTEPPELLPPIFSKTEAVHGFFLRQDFSSFCLFFVGIFSARRRFMFGVRFHFCWTSSPGICILS